MKPHLYSTIFLLLIYSLHSTSVLAQDEFADVIIDAFYSGVTPGFSDFYGQEVGGDCEFYTVSPAVCLGDTPDTFVSLPTGSYVTVGFTDNFIVDAPNQADIFIDEVGASDELADVYISSDFGITFTYFGEVNGGITSELDLADIGYTDFVNAIRIVGKDNLGCVPGFDLVRVFGIEGANCNNTTNLPPTSVLCTDTTNFNLNNLVTGSENGFWIGDDLINSSEFLPSETGTSSFLYIHVNEIALCPNDTFAIVIGIVDCDCNGTPNGTAVIDECGVCLEPDDSLFNRSCADCTGTPNGTAEVDKCGVCLQPNDPEFNQSCADCNGIPNGIAEIDECGVCLDSDDPDFNQSCADCNGIPNGTAEVDQCGVCMEPDDPEFGQSCLDCNGVANGTAEVDQCGVCLEPDDPEFNQSCADCNGVPNGGAEVDQCGVCLNPNNPDFGQSCLDCNGVLNGTAVTDECGICLPPDSPDFNQSCADCNGVPNGTSVTDECGVCLDRNSPAFNQSCADCNGETNGTAVVDECGVCIEQDSPDFNQSCSDCNGTPDGTAQIDDCGVCLDPAEPGFNQSCAEVQLEIPNTFTPNGDNQNDLWVIGNLDEFLTNRVTLFDRTGNMLIEFENYQNDWNGNLRGSPLPQGVYFYLIEVSGRSRKERGSVTIIR